METKGGDLSMPVPAIRDVIPWILSFGSKVKVLAPKSLAEHVRKEHYQAAKQYVFKIIRGKGIDARET